MGKIGYYLLSALIGSLISVMVVCNTVLGERVTMALSFMINHFIGIVALTPLVWWEKKQFKSSKGPWYLYFGGVFGFFIIHGNFITITHIGASMSMATAVFGQALGSLLFDLFGFMGMKTYPISKKKGLSLSLCFIGILIMAIEGGVFSLPYILIGIGVGFITIIQMVYNARLGAYKGLFFSARNNVLSGFIFALLIYSFIEPQQLLRSLPTVLDVPLPLVLSGGVLAMGVVVGTNYVIPKIPTIYSALILSSTQIVTSVIIDYLFFRVVTLQLLVGALLVIGGMVGNVILDYSDQKLSSSIE